MPTKKKVQCPDCKEWFKGLSIHTSTSARCMEKRAKSTRIPLMQPFSGTNDVCRPCDDHGIDFPDVDSNDHVEEDNCGNNDGWNNGGTVRENGPFAVPEQYLLYAHHTSTAQERGYTKMLAFFEKHPIPHCVFDELLDLLQQLSQDCFDFSATHPRRKSLVGSLKKKFRCAEPESVTVELEKDTKPDRRDHDNLLDSVETVEVIRFNIRTQIENWLASEIFYDVNNLNVCQSDVFGGEYQSEDGLVNEVPSAKWFRRTRKQMIQDPETEFLIPITFYLDKTGTDAMNRHGLEPVMFTSPLIKQSVIQKNPSKAWGHVAFLPDLDQRSKARRAYGRNNAERKGRATRNYHRCLFVALEQFIQLQKEGGMDCVVRIGGYYKKMRCKFPVAMIIGDAKSGDALCCRVPCYVDQARMSRACNVSAGQCASAEFECEWVLQAAQHRIVKGCMGPGKECDEDLRAELKKHSLVRCESCLFDVDFGANPHGQFRAYVMDPMHLFEGGWIKYICIAFIRPMNTLTRTLLDLFIEDLFRKNRSSRRKFFPRISFSGGITNLTLLACHEWVGVLLAIIMVAQTHKGSRILAGRLHNNDQKFLQHAKGVARARHKQDRRLKALKSAKVLKANERAELRRAATNTGEDNEDEEDDVDDVDDGTEVDPDNEEINFRVAPDVDEDDIEDDIQIIDANDVVTPRCSSRNILHLGEQVLCFHAYYKQGPFWKVNSRYGEAELLKSINVMIGQLTSTLDRGPGTRGWDLQKVHEIKHLPMQISEYGAPANTDAEHGERGLKGWAKKPAERVLKGSVDVFTQSTACRVHDGMVIAKAARCLDVGLNEKRRVHSLSSLPFVYDRNSEKQSGKLAGRPSYRVYYDHNEEEVVSEWLLKSKVELSSEIVQNFARLFQGVLRSGQPNGLVPCINGYTELTLPKGEVVRAHPNYQGNGPIFDWVIIQDPYNGQDLLTGQKVKPPKNGQNKQVYSHIQHNDAYRNYVPARVVAFYTDPETGVDSAMITPCKAWSQENYDNSSTIIESWNLQVDHRVYWEARDGSWTNKKQSKSDKRVQYYQPVYLSVPITIFKQGLFAFQEDGVLTRDWPVSFATGHVIVVIDRLQHWSKLF